MSLSLWFKHIASFLVPHCIVIKIKLLKDHFPKAKACKFFQGQISSWKQQWVPESAFLYERIIQWLSIFLGKNQSFCEGVCSLTYCIMVCLILKNCLGNMPYGCDCKTLEKSFLDLKVMKFYRKMREWY